MKRQGNPLGRCQEQRVSTRRCYLRVFKCVCRRNCPIRWSLGTSPWKRFGHTLKRSSFRFQVKKTFKHFSNAYSCTHTHTHIIICLDPYGVCPFLGPLVSNTAFVFHMVPVSFCFSQSCPPTSFQSSHGYRCVCAARGGEQLTLVVSTKNGDDHRGV